MNTLIIASFTSLLSLSAVAEPSNTDPVTAANASFINTELREEIETGIQTDLQHYTAQLSGVITQQAQQALFATAANLLILNSVEHKTDLDTLVPQMLLLAKKLAASTLNGE